MRILIWSQYFWPEIFQINEIANALSEEGHVVIVLTGKPNYPSGEFFSGYRGGGAFEERFGSVKVYRIPMLARGSGATRLALNYLSFVMSGYLNARRVLQGESFDLVFVYAPSPILQALPAISIAKWAKVPLVLWVQDLWPEALEATGFVRNRTMLGLVERVVRYIYNRADLLLAQSETFKQTIAERVLDPTKVVFFPNSEKFPDFDAKVSPAAVELAASMKNCFAVTFTGNLGSAQSLETLIDAAKALREFEDIKFFLVGSGSRLSWISDQIINQRLSSVVLAGQYPKEDMPIITQASAVQLLTLRKSVIGSATIPSKLQFYLAMGRPIIASADGEAARVVMASRSGTACQAGDGAALADAILDLRALSPQDRQALGANGRAYFEENFNLSGAAKRLLGLFEDARSRFGECCR